MENESKIGDDMDIKRLDQYSPDLKNLSKNEIEDINRRN